MIRIALPPLSAIRPFMRRLVLPLAFATLASTAQAADVIRKISELEPITPALTRMKADFETGGFRVDMPGPKIEELLAANGFVVTLRFLGSHGAGTDDKFFTTDQYDSDVKAYKLSKDESRLEKLTFEFLPGEGGVSAMSRYVEFRYRPGEIRLKRREVEADLIARLGDPAVTAQKAANKAANAPNAHVLGLYCFEADGTEMVAAGDCDTEKARTDGYSYDIETDEHGDVVSLTIAYNASSYDKSYKDALYAKMISMIENDQIAEFRK